MERYADWSPTMFDTPGLALPDRQDWLVVPVSQNRDSDPADQSNFATALKMLGGESDSVEVHRFGHWGPGWFEIILVKPDTSAADEAVKIEARLESYPLLDEDDASAREWGAANDTWANCYSLRERIRICADREISIFAARRETIPSEDNGAIFERCLGH